MYDVISREELEIAADYRSVRPASTPTTCTRGRR